MARRGCRSVPASIDSTHPYYSGLTAADYANRRSTGPAAFGDAHALLAEAGR